jgi:hypothetical protein
MLHLLPSQLSVCGLAKSITKWLTPGPFALANEWNWLEEKIVTMSPQNSPHATCIINVSRATQSPRSPIHKA